MSELLFSLVILEGLGALSLQAGRRGYFQGRLLKDEHLGVVSACYVDDEIPIFAPGTERLFLHWSLPYGTLLKQLVPWVEVKPGFSAAVAAKNVAKANLSEWTADGNAAPLWDEAVSTVCSLEPVNGGRTKIRLIHVYGEKVSLGDVHLVANEPRLSSRLDGLKPTQSLSTKSAAVIGVGSGGSMAAINLAAAGVGTLHLFDKDVLTRDNIFRHACDLRHLGRAKVLAVKDQIENYDLPAKIITHEQDVVADASELWEAAAEVDLLICATDSIQSRRLANYIAVHSRIPLVLACAFENAGIGEIIRVKPRVSACYECTRAALTKAGALELMTDVEESGSHVPYGWPAGREPERSSSQGSRADVAIVAALLARVAIMTLSEEPEADFLPHDYLVWGGRVSELTSPYDFERPFGTNWVELERDEECLVCADVGRPVDTEIETKFAAIMAGVNAQQS
jgi:molybdopterin/thiamine biosynthesis adenylyltransferase